MHVGDGAGRNESERREATSAHALPSAQQLAAEYSFLIDGGIDPALLQRVCEEAATTGIAPHWRLVTSNALTAQRYIDLLEAEIHSRTQRPFERVTGQRTEIVDAMEALPSQIAAAAAQARSRGNVPLLLQRQQIDWSEAPHSRKLRADLAANGLKRRHPELCAATRFAAWQMYSIPILIGTAAGGLIVMPAATIAVLAGAVAIPFLFIVGLRLLSLLIALRLPPLNRNPARVADAELPRYTVMVPLFREAEIVADTVAALRRLDYPPGKLDILIILESIDTETQNALRAIPLPPHMRAIIVPEQQPRTKPKALNYALRLSQGDYVVVYDAEDDPDPDQLRRAVAAFRQGPPNLMCMQARLAMDNPEPGWIANGIMAQTPQAANALWRLDSCRIGRWSYETGG